MLTEIELSNNNQLSSAEEICDFARQVIEIEANTLNSLSHVIKQSFYEAFCLISACQGTIFVSGVGKAGLVGQKIAATLASIGIPSVSLHPTDALHGDLGRIRKQDILLVLSNSGETEEVKLLLYSIKRLNIKIIAITGGLDSSIADISDIVIHIGNIKEACPLGLAPTASTMAMMAIGDAMALALVKARGFGKNDFAVFHPKGNLGRRLMRIKDVMRKDKKLPLAKANMNVKEVINLISVTLGRPGAAIIVDEQQHILGIFTDGNLRRLIQSDDLSFLSAPISSYMNPNPRTIYETQLVEEAVNLLKQYEIDQLPVINEVNQAVGLLDIQDIT